MKNVRLLTIFVAIAALLAVVNLAAALEPVPQESGFSGFIRPGVGYMRFKSNMVASFLGYDLSDKKINSRSDSPDAQSSGIVLAPFSLEYTFAESRTQLFLGTDLTDLIRFDYSQQVGIKQGIGDWGILQGGVLFSGVPAKVWKDPYLENQNRQETDRDSQGARLVWDRIFGSGLQLTYTYRKIDISSEKSGESVTSLTASGRELLERDGDTQTGEVLYRFDFGDGHTLAPAFAYTQDDRDGDAMTNAYVGNPISFSANAMIGWADYDKRNPIYGKTQDDDNYVIQGTFYYKNPWDWRLFGSNPMNFYIGAAYAKTNANIDFYDQEAFLTTAGVFFKW
jgi:hypothetical protein